MTKQKIKNIRFYSDTENLNTSSYLKFIYSLFQVVPIWYWGYIIFISIFFSLKNKEITYFRNFIQYPLYNTTPLNIYTFIVIILLPIPLIYIRFAKSYSFSSIYMDKVERKDRRVKSYNKSLEKNKDKVYSTDRYEHKFNYFTRTWETTNISAEERQKRKSNSSSTIMFLIYPIFLYIFLLIYLYIMYHIIILVAILVGLHTVYMYKKIKNGHYKSNSLSHSLKEGQKKHKKLQSYLNRSKNRY